MLMKLPTAYLVFVGVTLFAGAALAADAERAAGLIALYTFEGGDDDAIIRDRSGVKPPIDLQIEDVAAVEWREDSLLLHSHARIRSKKAPTRVNEAIRHSGALTVAAWVKPAAAHQTGPARIVSLSAGASRRNFTLGQDGSRYDVRLRSETTSSNGLPSLGTPDDAVESKLTFVVFTREPAGESRIYVDGRLRNTRPIPGTLASWDAKSTLLLGNEVKADRAWLGEFHSLAIYARALSEAEVVERFNNRSLNSHVEAPSPAEIARLRAEERFETEVAPLLARRCLQCHDAATKKGDLDLGHRTSAMTGGESGEVIVPGDSAASLLWDQIESGDMPPEGASLSAAEKQLLRDWIDEGAAWTFEFIDPALYAQDNTGEIWLQRLTVDEYIETVRAAVGVDISAEARELLPPDLRADGFSNTAYNLNVDLKHVEAYARLAKTIVERMDVGAFTARFSRARSLNTDATARELVEAMGKALFRGPLSNREEVLYSGIPTTVASAGGSFEEAAALMIESMLQSPRFLYRVEDQRGAGRVSGYELAARLSYIIWGGPPDGNLLDAAESGALYGEDELQSQVRRMLKDPRAVDQSRRFVTEWLDVERLAYMRPNQERFPGWSAELAHDMQQETLAFFKEIVWKQERPLADLLNAQFTYASPRLALHYGLEPNGADIGRYDLSEVPSRGGLLTQGTVLTIGGDDASMVTRGLFVLKDVLRGSVGDPPPGLDTTPVPSKPGLSQRLIAERRIENVACGGCHSKFEPLAFGLERFDGIGAYHERDEHGNGLRDDGEILFPGASGPVQYTSSAELMDLLAASDRVRESITWKLVQFALGRPLGPSDARVIRAVHATAEENEGTYQSLIMAIVTSDLVTRKKPM